MKKHHGANIVINTLEALGVEMLFGIPGIHNLDIYDALLYSSIRHITARHEQGAGFMADGYARSTGKTGVALVITGPGLTNIMTPMGQAFHDSIPLVVISSQIPSTFLGQRSGFLHELQNSTIMARSVAKESRCIMSTADIERYLFDAFHLAQSGRPGPVHVEIPMDVLQQKVPAFQGVTQQPPLAFQPEPEDSLSEAVQILKHAGRPVFILGGGASQAGKALTRLAECLGAIILETCAGKGSVDERHPLCLGARLHFPKVRDILKNADVVLVVGTELSPTDFWEMPFKTDGTIIQVDIDPANFPRNGRADLGISGDASHVANQLLQDLEHHQAPLEDVKRTVITIKQDTRRRAAAITGMGTEEYPLMMDILLAIRDMLPEDGILSVDMTGAAYVGLSEFPAYCPRSFLHPVGFGTLGFALPAAIGAKLASPEHVVVVLTGDGGFQFTSPELAVACQEQLAIPIILWNNQGFGEIRRYEERRHPGQRIAVDLQNPDFLKLAEAYNIAGIPVTNASEFRDAFAQALSASQPVIIEIHT